MNNLLQGCELHLHILGAFHAEDVLALGKDHYRSINWDEWGYIDEYQAAYGIYPDPIAAFESALTDGDIGFERFKKLHVYSKADGGDFGRWEAKFKFFSSVWTHYRCMGTKGDKALLRIILDRHRSEGLDYVEYRLGSGMDGFIYWHSLCAQVLQEASGDSFTARYILSLPRAVALEAYTLAQALFDQHPELIPIIVGVDFAGVEEGFPPKSMQPLFGQIAADNQKHPNRALDIVYHVGESYFDKSLESAIRWCHQVAGMGARRIGHAIALGLDPAVAIARRKGAHEREIISERLDQIAYDLRYSNALIAYDININEKALRAEQAALLKMDPAEYTNRPYDENRLEEVRRRQQFVLDRLVELGTVIECCPTSNLRIGGVPDPAHHPVHRFLASEVNLAICTDDPGNLDITLASEIDWVLEHTGMTEETLQKRLGDPRHFRLGQQRFGSN